MTTRTCAQCIPYVIDCVWTSFYALVVLLAIFILHYNYTNRLLCLEPMYTCIIIII